MAEFPNPLILEVKLTRNEVYWLLGIIKDVPIEGLPDESRETVRAFAEKLHPINEKLCDEVIDRCDGVKSEDRIQERIRTVEEERAKLRGDR